MVALSKTPSRRALMMATVALVPTLLFPLEVTAATRAEVRVQLIAEQVIAIARAGGSPKAFERVLNKHVAIGSVSRFALGKFRNVVPKSRNHQYRALFSSFIANLFQRYAKSFAGQRFEITRSSGKVVRGRIVHANGSSSPVEWRMAGRRVLDVKVQGVWLALVIRDEITSVLSRSRGDIDALFRFLQQPTEI